MSTTTTGALLAIALVAGPLHAQQATAPPTDSTASQDSVFQLATISVTASRSAITLFNTPAHVSVLEAALIRAEQPNNIADLFLDVPGLDAEGVGPTQRKPVIRGLIGQRVLLMEDGLRLNNTRREQDRGETPALVNMAGIERVEVVRGASSVLYGSDAIGGVINLITRRNDGTSPNRIHGRALLQYGSAGEQRRSAVSLWNTSSRISLSLDASYRKAESYSAPAGQFGDLALNNETTVNDTGVEDFSINGSIEYRLADRHSVSLKQSFYTANDAGFGFVSPGDLGSPGLTVQLLFPDQNFSRTTLRYSGTRLGSVFADALDFSGYYQTNERQFNTIVSGPLGPPGAALNSVTENLTDLETWGFRLEARKLVAGQVLLTYGSDLFRDGSSNTDISTRTVTGLGPPSTTTSGTRVPNAVFSSAGVFLQGQINPSDALDLTFGTRFQNVDTRSRQTAGITGPTTTASSQTVVGAAHFLYRLIPQLNLVGSIGRAFRSPNLVERFFQGVSPDGRAFWSVNGNLKPETSFNREAGLKFLGTRVELEGYVFRNTVFSGITDLATGQTIDGLPERRNENIDEIRFSGFELATRLALPAGFYASVGLSHLSGVADTTMGTSSIPGETYSTRLSTKFGYADPDGRISATYGIRFTSKKEDVDWRSSPVGDLAPSYTVHSLHLGIEVFPNQDLTISVDNILNQLYAETANMAFFRPEPGRNVKVALGFEF